MPRGGRRQGKPGSLYANRTDLAQGQRLPITTAPGQTYGEAKSQEDAQRAVPMGTPGAPQAPQGPAQPQSFGDLMDAAKNYQPTPVVPLGMETMRPDEHVMTGAAPAPPPPMQASPVLKGVALLNALGDNAPPEVKALRNVLAAQQGNEQAP